MFSDNEDSLIKIKDIKDMSESVRLVKEPLSSLFRALAHKKRIEILSYLSNKPLELIYLKELTQISKTALLNHLKILIDTNLVLRRSHGYYEITSDGKSFLKAMIGTFQTSELHSKSKKIQQAQRYSMSYQKDIFLVSNPAKYSGGYLSFIGSVTGILHSFGEKVDISDVGGYTGYAFLYNMAKGITCPSSPTNHSAFEEFIKGLNSFGWKVDHIKDMYNYPSAEIPTENDLLKAYSFFNLVKEKLQKTKRPVILWGIPIPEFGIVNGYEENNYIVSTIRQKTTDFGPETPIRYDLLQAPNRLELFSFESKVNITKNKDRKAIDRAIRILSGDYSIENYILGTEMFDEWSKTLEKGGNMVTYHGNSYMGYCTKEASFWAKTFLLNLSLKYKNKPQGIELENASKEFQSISININRFNKIFPFGLKGDLSKKKLQQGKSLIQSNCEPINSALTFLQEAINSWE